MARTPRRPIWLRGLRVPALSAMALASCAFVAPCLRAEPLFRMGTAAATAGESALTVPLEIETHEGEGLVASWSAVVSYDPAVVTAVKVENLIRADVFGYRTHALHGMPGILILWAIYSLADDTSKMIPAGSVQEVASVEFCVLGSASTGTYGLTFLTQSPQDHRYFTSATSFTGTYDTRSPFVEPGAISISGDASSTSTCVPEIPDLPPPEPTLKGTFKLGDESAIRGLPVAVPFTINAEEKVLGFSFSVDFDEEVLEAVSVRPTYEASLSDPSGSRNEYEQFEMNNSNDAAGNGGIDEGFITGAVVFDLVSSAHFLPPSLDNEVLRLNFLVLPRAPLGTTEVRFLDGGRFLTIAQKNAFVAGGGTVYPDSIPASVLVNARLSIIGDVSPFRFTRGDANDDGKVDIADSVRTFMFLFLGADAPGCLDTADSNDDGVIDISDGVRILNHFFGPPAEIPYPGPLECGYDLEPDTLGCESYPHCPQDA